MCAGREELEILRGKEGGLESAEESKEWFKVQVEEGVWPWDVGSRGRHAVYLIW